MNSPHHHWKNCFCGQANYRPEGMYRYYFVGTHTQVAYEAIDFWIIICCFAYWRQNTNHFLTGIRTEMMLKLADIYIPIFCFFTNCEIYIRKNSMRPSKYIYLFQQICSIIRAFKCHKSEFDGWRIFHLQS